MTPDEASEVDERVAVAVETAKDEVRHEFHSTLHRRSIWQDFLPSALIALVMILGGWQIVKHEAQTDCRSRQQAREAVRTGWLTLLPLTPEGSRVRTILQDDVLGKLPPISC